MTTILTTSWGMTKSFASWGNAIDHCEIHGVSGTIRDKNGFLHFVEGRTTWGYWTH